MINSNLRNRKYLGSIVFSRMKKWSRAGIENEFDKVIFENAAIKKVLVVGGFGPVLNYIKTSFPNLHLTTLDIDENHKPDLLADLSDPNLLNEIDGNYDLIVIVEVLEHIHHYLAALRNIYGLLEDNGILFGSTPWLMPIHDAPYDFLRFSHYEISRSLQEVGFSQYTILGRGNIYDVVILLGFRGLLERNFGGKVLTIFAFFLSFLKKTPKLHDIPIGFTYGYVFRAQKSETYP